MKRSRTHRAFGPVVLLLAAIFAEQLGCSVPSGPQLGSQTNWLVQCDVSNDCDRLECLCGACTQACEPGACDDLPGSVCVPQSDPGVVALCGGGEAPSALCLPRCDDGVCESGKVCVSGVCMPGADVTDEIVIDLGTRYQALVGFGAGIGFTEDLIAQHPLGDELYDVLFADSGLDALRIRNRYDGTNDADLAVLAGIVDAARTRLGREPTLFLSEGSPPPALKANGSRGCGGNGDTCTIVQTEPGVFDYGGFAQHWRTSLDAYGAAGVTFGYLGIQNHPNFVPPAEAPGEACRFLPEEGMTAVSVDGADVMMLLPGYLEAHAAVESALVGLENAPVLTEPDTTAIGDVSGYVEPRSTSASDVGALSIHLYGMNPDDVDTASLEAIRSLSEQFDVPVLQTELRAPLHDTVIFLHYTLTSAWAAAYLQNDLIAKNDDEEAVALVRLTDDAYELLPLYDVFAHYARYTEPGYVRVAADVTGDGVLASAWLAPDESALSVVLTNPTDVELSVRVSLPEAMGAALTRSTVVRSVFSGVERSADLGPLPEDGVVRLPPGAMATVALTSE